MRKFPYISVVVLFLAAILTSCGSDPLAKCSQEGRTFDCSYLDLEGARFKDKYLPAANFTMANLKEAKFDGSDLPAASFYKANLHGVYLQSSNFNEAYFSEAKLTAGDLYFGTQEKVNFSQADLRSSNLEGVFLDSVFDDARFSLGVSEYHLHFRQSSLKNASFGGFEFREWRSSIPALFTDSDMTSVDFTRAKGPISITRSTADFADFEEAQLYGYYDFNIKGQIIGEEGEGEVHGSHSGRSRFTDSDFRFANFTGADLREAVFTNSDLSDATFTNANLTGADLSSAVLTNANFKGAFADSSTLWPSGFDLVGHGGYNRTARDIIYN